MFDIVLVFLLVTGVHSRPEKLYPPELRLYFGGQSVTFLLDINSVDTFILSNKVNGITEGGFDNTKSPLFIDLKTKISNDFDSTLNEKSSEITGILSQDELDQDYYMGTAYNGTFVLVNEMEGFPSRVNANDTVRMGRMGLWLKSPKRRTTLGDVIFGKISGFKTGFSALCKQLDSEHNCSVFHSAADCIRWETEPTGFRMTVSSHPKNYWQVDATGYTYGSFISSRNFNVIFSTTRPDFVIPKQLFSLLTSQLKPKNVDGEYKFDCSLKSKAEPIILKLRKDITITPTVYIDKINGECFLRVRPSTNNDWVLGYQLYYQYNTCFHSFSKRRQVELSERRNIPE